MNKTHRRRVQLAAACCAALAALALAAAGATAATAGTVRRESHLRRRRGREEDIFPDPMSASIAEGWRGGVAKALERESAALAQAEPIGS